MDNLTWEQACEKEKEFISLYGRKNTKTGVLCNMTDGGEGTLNIKFSEERRKSISIRNLGNTYGSLTKGRKHTEEARNKISFAFCLSSKILAVFSCLSCTAASAYDFSNNACLSSSEI